MSVRYVLKEECQHVSFVNMEAQWTSIPNLGSAIGNNQVLVSVIGVLADSCKTLS